MGWLPPSKINDALRGAFLPEFFSSSEHIKIETLSCFEYARLKSINDTANVQISRFGSARLGAIEHFTAFAV
jgi:hypothetical protein